MSFDPDDRQCAAKLDDTGFSASNKEKLYDSWFCRERIRYSLLQVEHFIAIYRQWYPEDRVYEEESRNEG